MMKEDVRRLAKESRNALSSEEVREHSARICAFLQPMLKHSNGIYLPYGNEVDVTSLVADTEAIFAIPKTFANHTIRFYRFHEAMQMEKSKYGIWEPRNGEELSQLEVLIIPLVAFDRNCNRLGHGGGYYDRYLQHFTGLRIGVAHECQRVEDVYPQMHDEVLDYVVSEEAIYKRTDRL